MLCERGAGTLLCRLSGYVFFGSASKIDAVFQTLDDKVEGVVIDFSNVSGIDSSAAAVFQRILRRYRDKPTRFYLIHASINEVSLRAIAGPLKDSGRVAVLSSLDHAVETAEDTIIATGVAALGDAPVTPLAFLESTNDRDIFLSHCELRHVAAGELLCREDEHSAACFPSRAAAWKWRRPEAGPPRSDWPNCTRAPWSVSWRSTPARRAPPPSPR